MQQYPIFYNVVEQYSRISEKEKLGLDNLKFENQSRQLKNLENEFMRMKFDLVELLHKEEKNSKLYYNQNKYYTITKYVKYSDSEIIYVKDLDGGEIIY